MNKVDALIVVYAVAAIALVLIYITNSGFSTFVVFSKDITTQAVLTLPLNLIKISDNSNGILFVTITSSRLYYLTFEGSVASSVVGLVLLLIIRFISKDRVSKFGRGLSLELLIPMSLLTLGLLLMIPLPVSIYLSGGYVVIMTNIGIAFSGVFLLLSSVTLLAIVTMYGKYGELTELAIEVELTESNTVPMEYGEVTDVS